MNLPLLRSELEFVSRAVERKSTIPILKNVLLDHNRGVLTLTGTDLEISAISGFRAPGGKLKSTVPAKLLSKVLASLNGNPEVTLAADKGYYRLKVESGSFVADLSGMRAESYPAVTTPEGESITLSGRTLNTMMQYVKHAIFTEESRFTLHGALLYLSSTGLRLIATDGHRLAIIHEPAITGDARFLVQAALIALFPDLGKGDVQVQVGKNHTWFTAKTEAGMRVLMARKMTGNFPDYERVLPKSFAISAMVKREPLLKLVVRMKGLADERSLCGELTAVNTLGRSAIEIAISLSETKAQDSIAAGFTSEIGKGVRIGLNLEYVEHALRALDSEDVRLDFNDEHSAMQISGTRAGIAALDVIIPVRL